LELFDTRKALEETRRELSQSLYQNDAAVRVIARLAMERDAAREKLASVVAQTAEERAATVQAAAPAPAPAAGEERKNMDVEPPIEIESEETATKSTSSSSPMKIAQVDLDKMISSWKVLSKNRKKKKTKSGQDAATSESLSKYKCVDSKSLHKSNKKGVLCLCVQQFCSGEDNDSQKSLVVSGGVDKQAIVYDTSSQKVVGTLGGATKEVTHVDIHQSLNRVVSCSKDGTLRVYDATEDDYEFIGSVSTEQEEDVWMGVDIHPTGDYLLAVTALGNICFCGVVSEGETKVVTKLAEFRDDGVGGDDGVRYTCSGLHPDGLILGVGTTDGSLKVWDLKTQALASTLKGHEGSVTHLSFSENGYHFASSSSTGEVICWDLRKQKQIATINKPSDDDTIGAVSCVEFDTSGKYLAYVGEEGARITIIKEWGTTASFDYKGGTSLAWGPNANWVVTSSMDRAIKFWGEEEEEDKDIIPEGKID